MTQNRLHPIITSFGWGLVSLCAACQPPPTPAEAPAPDEQGSAATRTPSTAPAGAPGTGGPPLADRPPGMLAVPLDGIPTGEAGSCDVPSTPTVNPTAAGTILAFDQPSSWKLERTPEGVALSPSSPGGVQVILSVMSGPPLDAQKIDALDALLDQDSQRRWKMDRLPGTSHPVYRVVRDNEHGTLTIDYHSHAGGLALVSLEVLREFNVCDAVAGMLLLDSVQVGDG